MLTDYFRWMMGSRRWLSFAMLVSLHLTLWLGLRSTWAVPLLLVHLGLFLLWQPLWRGERELRPLNAVLIVALSTLALFWLNYWVIAFWVGGLFALVGGRAFSFHTRWHRIYYLLVMAYLLAILMLYVAPKLLGASALGDDVTEPLMVLVLPALLFIMALLPVRQEKADAAQAVDFIYILLLFALQALLVLGSVAFMLLGKHSYLDALVRTLFILALVLFALGGLWNPRSGFSGMESLFSRYLLTIGTPLEEWLKRVAVTAQQESDPEVFLERAVVCLLGMPWIAGLTWVTANGHGNHGVASPHRMELVEGGLVLTVFSHRAVTPTVMLHVRLLSQLLAYFYQSKQRERHLREMSRLQAVYETGARLTHDLKNLLQSLYVLTNIAQFEPEKAQPVLQRQLPVMSQRIEDILGKLRLPQEQADTVFLPAAQWWEALRQRHQHRRLEWQGTKLDDEVLQVPAALLDSVADNLIDNACKKQLRETGVRVSVHFSGAPLELSVCDSGSAIPPQKAAEIFNTVLSSEEGLGVGMYQVARWARQMGYALSLQDNQPGKVCFVLKEVGAD